MNCTYNTVLATEGKNKDKIDTIWDLLEAPHVFGMNSAYMKDRIRSGTEMTEADGVSQVWHGEHSVRAEA